MILTHEVLKYKTSNKKWRQAYITIPKRVADALGEEQIVSLIIMKQNEKLDNDDDIIDA